MMRSTFGIITSSALAGTDVIGDVPFPMGFGMRTRGA